MIPDHWRQVGSYQELMQLNWKMLAKISCLQSYIPQIASLFEYSQTGKNMNAGLKSGLPFSSPLKKI